MSIPQMMPEEAHQLMQQGHRYIDVRTEGEFSYGHPQGAVNVPVFVEDPATGGAMPNKDFIAVVGASFGKDAKLILGCQSGMRSQRAAEMLAAAGYTDVANLQGGFGGGNVPGWTQCGLPVSNDVGPENSYDGMRAKLK